MLKTFNFRNEEGKIVVTKTYQYERGEEYTIDFSNKYAQERICILYNLSKVIENVQKGNIIYLVSDIDMIKSLEMDGKFATCIACNTYNKKVIQDGLKYLKNATVYIINDGADCKEKIKNFMAEDKDNKDVCNKSFKTNKNILKELVNITKELKLLDYSKYYKTDAFFRNCESIIELFEFWNKDVYFSKKNGSYHIQKRDYSCLVDSWQEFIDSGININKKNCNQVFKQYQYQAMLFSILNRIIA